MLQDFFSYLHQLQDKLGWWTVVGATGQVVFGCRFLVQWIASERKKESVVPRAFWHLSIVGSLINLTYGFGIRELPVMAGYLFNLIPYVRNLMLIRNKDREATHARVEREGRLLQFAASCDHADPVVAVCRRCMDFQCATCARPRAGFCGVCGPAAVPA